ncbi:YjbH domain-containing protein [Jannaschia seohaensis]|uniref:Exopolysaccharide biosynthesis protein YbjH n=1 Tax=Jannaschia seohaensis TaxID=475081 RepID=A0A2Y9C8D9_9RHOB|nr:YjbH domain-containing protein [Jannaschia seohaensis]PWJ16516.1 exopolysaccharide biosynthesis protein YbjH [Jannaschia seohaensis]SSA48753.1 Exopolysaccharide biosynthesis protein YbjH [Jannaschia seohaensis]
MRTIRTMLTGRTILTSLLCAGLVAPAGAQQAPEPRRSVSSYGVPGLIDMPSAQMQPDGEIVTSIYGLSNGSGRTQLSFQILPRVQGVFRYATIPDFLRVGDEFIRTYDRSFDVRFQVLKENGWIPDVTVGLQDFGGTSLFSGEYVVASKTFGPQWTATAGIGWGRFGSAGSFTNPLVALDERFRDRPRYDVNTSGGQFSTSSWFRGDAALFAGVEFRPNDRWTLKAEYSSDGYREEEARGIFDRKSPLNFGVEYNLAPGIRLGGYAVGGSEFGFNIQLALNPKRPPTGGSGLEGAALPVALRPSRDAQPQLWSEAWVGAAQVEEPVVAGLDAVLAEAGLELISYRLTGDRVDIRFRNPRYASEAQAIGRAARAMAATLPPSVETFVLTPENERSLGSASVILRRSDLEAIENRPNGAAEMLAVAGIVDSASLPTDGRRYVEDAYPRLNWNIGPYIGYSLFDPDNPFRVDVGLAASAEWEPVRGLVLGGEVRQKLIGNRDESVRESNSVLPRVRTNGPEFLKTDDPFIPYLTASYFFRPGQNLYARGTVGLLEREFGGVSGEVLWKPVNSRLAIGVEANIVRQREFDGLFGFQDLEAETAFISAYYDHGARFYSQLDVGQYLAGDRGATYTLTREFSNGWQVGAYATRTNVSAEEFGEGSFDKGFFLRIPTDWLLGRPTRQTSGLTIQPVQRDGGARLTIRDRLYPLVRSQSAPDLTERWGRFWR